MQPRSGDAVLGAPSRRRLPGTAVTSFLNRALRTAERLVGEDVSDGAPTSTRALMAYAAGFLWVGGGTLAGVSVLIGMAPGSFVPGVVGVAVLALTVAGILFWAGARTPIWIYHVLLASGTGLIALLTLMDGAPASAFGNFYVWVALWVYYFFPLRQALLHTAIVIVVAAVSLHLKGPHDVPDVRLLLTCGTVLVTGILIHRLVSTVNRLVLVDSLTGIANRRQWDNELPRALEQARRDQGSLTVAILDLDHFKQFNDDHGHLRGDALLQESAIAWSGLLRSGDTLARYGGEEFAVILPGVSLTQAVEIVNRLRAATPSGVSSSAGVALWDEAESPAELLDRADAALYEAKFAGRNRTVVAEAGRGVSPHEAGPQHYIKRLPEILELGAVRAVFQPIVRFSDGAIIAFEALTRGADAADDASVEPLFAAAQRMGMSRELDWICRTACVEASAGFPADATVCINVSVAALLSPLHSPEQMVDLVAASGRQPSSMVLELTERDLVADMPRFVEVIEQYRRRGFRFALDDIGDGHSTLEVLAIARPEFVKIARSLTNEAHKLGAGAAIAAVVAFARASGATVIAEGIENRRQALQMEALGASCGQGYLLGRPAGFDAWRGSFAA